MFSREFKDLRSQYGNGFQQIIWQRLVKSSWLISTEPNEILIPMKCRKHQHPSARARKIHITLIMDFGQLVPILAQMCFDFFFFLGGGFLLGASANHVQGSISNARGALEPKTPASSQTITPKKFGQKCDCGGQKIGATRAWSSKNSHCSLFCWIKWPWNAPNYFQRPLN